MQKESKNGCQCKTEAFTPLSQSLQQLMQEIDANSYAKRVRELRNALCLYIYISSNIKVVSSKVQLKKLKASVKTSCDNIQCSVAKKLRP